MSDCGKVADEIKAIYDFCKRNRAAILCAPFLKASDCQTKNGSNVFKTPLDRFPDSGIIAKCDMDRHLMDVAIRSGHLWEGFLKPWPITA
jgi:hypothetical protein